MKSPLIMGWREWIELPELGVARIKAKVDTGARSSSLHAEDIELFQLRGEVGVRFVVLPLQRSRLRPVPCQAPLYDERYVKSSNGSRELRPVIRTAVRWGGQVWEVDVTLTSRDLMGFRMLLGREAIRRRFLVDTGRSYFGGRAIAAAQPLPSLVPAVNPAIYTGVIPGTIPAVIPGVAHAPAKKKRRGSA